MPDSTPTTQSERPPSPPSPPPLPPKPLSSQNPQQPRGFLAKLESAPEDWVSQIPATPPETEPYRYEPVYYFFYGTLVQPDMLKEVLGLTEEPELREAKVVGYSLSAWGQYKALVDGEQGEEVSGRAFQVQSPEHEYKLAYYETSAYELAPCLIQFTDGEEPSQVQGKTFMYAGDAQVLKEGRFDRKLWELQMGMRLPPSWGKDTSKADDEPNAKVGG
ncbi:hypothetical protein FDECE_14610 [Fusarium decemcellulare]|nr:hypothetical protein FDECE_14610 [Fusarium decemcellulare]